MTKRFFCDAVTADGLPGGSHFLRQPCQGWKGWELMISAWSFDDPPFYLMVFGGEEHAPEN